MRPLDGEDARRPGRRNRSNQLRGVLAATVVPLLLLLWLALAAACGKGPLPSASAPISESREQSPPRAATKPEWSGYLFTPSEKAAVSEFLIQHPNLRVATDADRSSTGDQSGFRNLYGIYHPYFVRGDLNDDGILDFVLSFVRRDGEPRMLWFSVVVFTGRERSDGGREFAAGTFLERDISLMRGEVSIDRDAILITPDLAEDAVRRYRWDPIRCSYIYVREEGEGTETPVLSQT